MVASFFEVPRMTPILAEGGQLDDPATFVKRVNQLMLEMTEGKSDSAVPG